MKTSVLGLLAASFVATLSTRANAICVSTFTNCLGKQKTVTYPCPDCPTSTPPKPTDGCTYAYTLCPDGSRGYFNSVTITCGGCTTP